MPDGEGSCRVCGVPLARAAEGPVCGACRGAPPSAEPPRQVRVAADIPSPGTEVDGLVVRRRLDDGAMGHIVLAHDPGLDRDVVLKFIHARLVGDRRAELRFLREGRALAGVDHPNVVRVFAVGRWRGRPYLSMEYVEGAPLSRTIRGARMAVADALRVGEDVAAALAAIHDRRIVHGDVKPDNVVLRQRDGSACLLDFGLARPLTATEPESMAAGTPLYMAPEQIAGGRADTRADVYSFGVTLYEMLTGCAPHEHADGAAFYHSVLHRDAPPVSSHRSDVPRGLETLIGHALARARELRQPDGRALLAEVRSLRRSLEPGDRPAATDEPTTDELAPPHDPAEDLPLVGRDAEYAEAVRAIAKVPGGRGCVILVEGAAGAGTSRFLRELARRACADGLAVLRCCGAESARAPHAVLREALLEAARTAGADGADAAAALLARASPDDEPLAPVLRRLLAPGVRPPEVSDDKATVARAALALLRVTSAERPTALVVDDLHLVDEGSLDVISALAGEAACMPLAVVAATRPATALPRDAPLAARLPRVRAAPRLTSVVLGPLPVGAVAAMIHSALRVDESEACRLAPLLHRRASGNPLYLVEALRLLDQEGHVEEAAGARSFRERVSTLQIPPRLMELALRRIAGLPAEERDTLGVVSIDPEGVTSEFVARCRGTSKLAALRVLQQLVGARGLVQHEGDRYVVAHSEIREAVNGETIPELRAEYHRLAADAIAAAGESDAQPARLGRHLRLAGRRAEAVAPLLAAGAALLSGYSPAEALDRLEEAIACAGPGGCPAAEVARARAFEMLGGLERARTELVRLADVPGEPGVEALLLLVAFERNRGRDEAAAAALQRALAREASREQTLAMHLHEAELASRGGRADAALAALASADALADGAPRSALLALWAQNGAVRFRLNRLDEAKVCLRRALVLAEDMGYPEYAANCMLNLSLACDELGRMDESLAWAERAVERAALLGAERQRIFALLGLVAPLVDSLRLDEAETVIARLTDAVARFDSDEARYAVSAKECELALARRQFRRAIESVDRALALSASHPRNHANLRVLRCEALLGLGRSLEACEEARAARAALTALGADDEAEEALALIARSLRLSGVDGPERHDLRRMTDAHTFVAAVERLMVADSASERARWRAAAQQLARHARWKAELDAVEA